jgi:hypothetical protein
VGGGGGGGGVMASNALAKDMATRDIKSTDNKLDLC